MYDISPPLQEDKDDDFISDYVSNNIIRDFAGVLVSVGEYTQENRNLVPTSDHYMVFTQSVLPVVCDLSRVNALFTFT